MWTAVLVLWQVVTGPCKGSGHLRCLVPHLINKVPGHCLCVPRSRAATPREIVLHRGAGKKDRIFDFTEDMSYLLYGLAWYPGRICRRPNIGAVAGKACCVLHILGPAFASHRGESTRH